MVKTSGVYPRTLQAWFDPSAFHQQAPGTFGNAGRFSLVAPGSINWDMAVSREFPFRERWRLNFRADFFNIMNHANWLLPPTGNTISITSGTFGQVTTFGAPRVIQMSMKLFF